MRPAGPGRALPALVLALVAACGRPDAPPAVEDPWVRAGPPGMSMLAGYLVLENPGAGPVELTGVSSADFGRVELHRTVMADGMARMRPEGSVTVPAGGRVAFEPGGRHLMLMDPVRPLAPGDAVTLTLRFADGRTLEVAAEVREGSGDPHAGHRH